MYSRLKYFNQMTVLKIFRRYLRIFISCTILRNNFKDGNQTK